MKRKPENISGFLFLEDKKRAALRQKKGGGFLPQRGRRKEMFFRGSFGVGRPSFRHRAEQGCFLLFPMLPSPKYTTSEKKLSTPTFFASIPFIILQLPLFSVFPPHLLK